MAKKLKLVYGVQLKMKDGTINSTDVPGFQSRTVPSLEMSGINFPKDNGLPYVEYRILTRLDWSPFNADNNFPYLEGPWMKSQMAGVCLNFNPPVPFTIQITEDLTSLGISKILRVHYTYEILGKQIQYSIPFSGSTALSEILIPEPGLT